MKKKVLALVLALVMVVSTLPISVFAQGLEEEAFDRINYHTDDKSKARLTIYIDGQRTPQNEMYMKLYDANGNLMSVTTVKDLSKLVLEPQFHVHLTGSCSCHKTVWEDGHPNTNIVPAKAKIYRDGVHTGTVDLNIPLSKWRGLSYKVTFDTVGGSTVDTQYVLHNKTVTNPADPSKDGYKFGGWYKERTCENEWNFSTDRVSANTTLYAKWNALYTVKFNANGGTGTMADQNFVYSFEQALTANTFTKTGCTFKGWATADDGAVVYADTEAVKNLTQSGTFNLYAVWERNMYDVSVTKNAGGEVYIAATALYDATVPVTITPETGFKVNKAQLEYNGTTEDLMGKTSFVMPAADVKLVVEFVRQTTPVEPAAASYKVEYYFQQLDGSYALDNAETLFPVVGTLNDEITAADHELDKAGYHLNDALSTSVVVAMPTVNNDELVVTTLKMYYDLNEYSITVEQNAGGTVVVPESALYTKDVAYTITANDGFALVLAKMVCSGEETVLQANDNFAMPAGDVKLVVEFVRLTTPVGPAQNNTYYFVEHYVEQPDGSYKPVETEVLNGEIGTTVTADSTKYDDNAHHVNTAKSTLNGVVSLDLRADHPEETVLTLKVYYDITPYYPPVDPTPVIPFVDVDIHDDTLSDAAKAVGSAVKSGNADITPVAGYTKESIAQMQKGNALKLVVEKKNSYDPAEKSLIDKAAQEKGKTALVQFLEIDVTLRTMNDVIVAEVDDTIVDLTITVDLNAEMQKAAKEGKTIYVARAHDGKVTFIEGTLNAEKTQFTFDSSKFSTYALVALDGETVTSAKTADPIGLYFGVTALATVGSAWLAKKKED